MILLCVCINQMKANMLRCKSDSPPPSSVLSNWSCENRHRIKSRSEMSCEATPHSAQYVTRARRIIIEPGQLKLLVRAQPLRCHLHTGPLCGRSKAEIMSSGQKTRERAPRPPILPPPRFKWALYNDGRWFYTLGSSSVSWSGCCGHLELVPPSGTQLFHPLWH